MHALFTLALFATAIAAKGGKTKTRRVEAGDDPEFVKFAAKNGKNYKTKGDFMERQTEFKKHDDAIKKNNKNADDKKDFKAVRLQMNWTGDLTDKEYEELLTLKQESAEFKKEAEAKGQQTDGKKALKSKKGRKMQDGVRAFDHADAGHMTAVKNQGQCGSCWAFTATSVMEAVVAATTGTAPVRLSEQQLMDCD